MAFPTANHFAFCIFLTVMLSRGIKARPENRLYYPEIDMPQYIDETENMDDDVYSEIKRYPVSNPAFLAKRQSLRDIFRQNYGDDEIGTNLDDELPERIPTPLPLQKKNPKVKNKKDHADKKNIISGKNYYMHPCPFKICTMGRKRNVRYLQY